MYRVVGASCRITGLLPIPVCPSCKLIAVEYYDPVEMWERGSDFAEQCDYLPFTIKHGKYGTFTN